MTLEEANTLAKLLKSLCILKKGQVLHVNGHVILVR